MTLPLTVANAGTLKCSGFQIRTATGLLNTQALPIVRPSPKRPRKGPESELKRPERRDRCDHTETFDGIVSDLVEHGAQRCNDKRCSGSGTGENFFRCDVVLISGRSGGSGVSVLTVAIREREEAPRGVDSEVDLNVHGHSAAPRKYRK
jgi:hypothetical protein